MYKSTKKRMKELENYMSFKYRNNFDEDGRGEEMKNTGGLRKKGKKEIEKLMISQVDYRNVKFELRREVKNGNRKSRL